MRRQEVDSMIDKNEQKKTTLQSLFRIPLNSSKNKYKVKELLEKKLNYSRLNYSTKDLIHREKHTKITELSKLDNSMQLLNRIYEHKCKEVLAKHPPPRPLKKPTSLQTKFQRTARTIQRLKKFASQTPSVSIFSSPQKLIKIPRKTQDKNPILKFDFLDNSVLKHTILSHKQLKPAAPKKARMTYGWKEQLAPQGKITNTTKYKDYHERMLAKLPVDLSTYNEMIRKRTKMDVNSVMKVRKKRPREKISLRYLNSLK